MMSTLRQNHKDVPPAPTPAPAVPLLRYTSTESDLCLPVSMVTVVNSPVLRGGVLGPSAIFQHIQDGVQNREMISERNLHRNHGGKVPEGS